MDEVLFHEKVAELERQIELIEEFLDQRKDLVSGDKDLKVKLKKYRSELDRLLLIGPFEEISDELIVD